MAGELQVDGQITGMNVYFLVRNTVGQILNVAGDAFETYSTVNYVNYVISGAEQGTASAYYTATFPPEPANVYGIVAKQQIGGTAAETDPSIGWQNLEWGGSGVSVFASGRVWLGSGHPTTLYSGQTARIYSGNLSGQLVSLNSGSTVGVVSGTLFPASGATQIASGNFVNVYSGQLSGQTVNVASGTMFPASGATRIASGAFVVAPIASGSLSGQFLDSNIVAINGGSTNGYNATLKLKMLDVYNASGNAVQFIADNVDAFGLVAQGFGTGAGIYAEGGHLTGPGIAAVGRGPGLYAQSIGSGNFANGIQADGGSGGVGIKANILGNVSGEVYPVSGFVWLASGSIPLSGQASLSSGAAADVAAAVLRYNASGIQTQFPPQSLGMVTLKQTSKFNALSGVTYLTDGTTVAMTQTPTKTPGMQPISQLDVGQ